VKLPVFHPSGLLRDWVSWNSIALFSSCRLNPAFPPFLRGGSGQDPFRDFLPGSGSLFHHLRGSLFFSVASVSSKLGAFAFASSPLFRQTRARARLYPRRTSFTHHCNGNRDVRSQCRLSYGEADIRRSSSPDVHVPLSAALLTLLSTFPPPAWRSPLDKSPLFFVGGGAPSLCSRFFQNDLSDATCLVVTRFRLTRCSALLLLSALLRD